MKSNFSQRLTAVFLLLCMLFSLAPAMAEGSVLHAYCYGFNVTKDASDKPTGFSFKIGAQFGTAPYTLNWAVSGAASVSGSASNAATITLPGSFPTGEYTFTVNAQDAAGAQKTAVMKVSYTVDEAFNCSQSILSSVNPQTVKVSKIQLDKTSLTLKSQEYVQLIHTVEPANAANREVLWSSSNAGVVDVDQSGRIQALREGTAVITCTAKDGSGVYATCAVTVAQRVVNLTLNATAVTVSVGGTYKLTPTIAPDNAANKEVTFTSGNNAVVVVANDGTLTGVSNGVAAVTVASKDNPAIMATCIVTVGTPVETITVSPKAVELTTGTSLTLSATVAPATATNKTLVWASSDTAVATVDQSGRVSVWKAGSATITVRAVDGSGAQDTCTVTATGNDVTPPTTTPPSTETTTPPSTETTTPPAGTWTMYVDTVEGGLNLRNDANQGATRLLVIPRHAAVSVVTYGPTWCYVWYNGTSGYVMTKFLSSSIGSGTQTTPPSSSSTYAYVVTETGRLNLRTNKNQNAGIIAKIEPGESVRIIDYGSTWSKVSYNGRVGFVMSKFLSFTAPETTTPPPSTETTTPPPSTETTTPPPSTEMYGRVTTEQGRLNLRTNKNLNAGIIAKIEPGEYVKVLEYGSTWCRVTYNGRAGYVMTKFLTFGAAEETTTPPPSTETTTPPSTETTTPPPSTETTTPPPSTETTTPPSTETTTPPPLSSSTYAYVVTPSGRLNMRSSRSQNAGIIARIDPGTQIKVLEYGSTWCKINYNGRAGFVMTKFLSTTKPEIAPPSTETTTPPSTETTRPPESTGSTKYAQVVTEQGSLNMRYSQSIASALITRIPQNAYVQVLSTGSTWCRVTYGGHTGYVMTKFLSFAKHAPSSEGNQTVLVKSSGKMYKEASTGSAVLAEVVAGDYIVIYDDNGTWAHALHLGKIGYVKSTCLTLPEGTAMQNGVSVYADRTYTFENDSAVVGTLNVGDKVQILHCYGDTWWKVRMSNGTVGYVVCKVEVLKVPNW